MLAGHGVVRAGAVHTEVPPAAGKYFNPLVFSELEQVRRQFPVQQLGDKCGVFGHPVHEAFFVAFGKTGHGDFHLVGPWGRALHLGEDAVPAEPGGAYQALVGVAFPSWQAVTKVNVGECVEPLLAPPSEAVLCSCHTAIFSLAKIGKKFFNGILSLLSKTYYRSHVNEGLLQGEVLAVRLDVVWVVLYHNNLMGQLEKVFGKE